MMTSATDSLSFATTMAELFTLTELFQFHSSCCNEPWSLERERHLEQYAQAITIKFKEYRV